MDIRLQPLRADDRTAVIDLFNHYVVNSFAAFSEQPMGYEFFDLLLKAVGSHPTITAKDPAGRLLGFGLLRPHHPFPVFARTAEITYFVAPDATRLGIGSRMLAELLARAKDRGIATILAPICSLNEPSLAFHRKHGFAEVGRFRQIGRKNACLFDVIWMQKTL